MTAKLPEPITLPAIRYWQRSRPATKLKRYVRGLGRQRAFELAGMICHTLPPAKREEPWVSRAIRLLADLPPRPRLVDAYDNGHREGTIQYPTRSFLHAIDLVALLRTARPFEHIYRQFLWAIFLSSGPLTSPEMTEGEFFRILSELHARQEPPASKVL